MLKNYALSIHYQDQDKGNVLNTKKKQAKTYCEAKTQNEILQHVFPKEADVDTKSCARTDSIMVYGRFADHEWRNEECDWCSADRIRRS